MKIAAVIATLAAWFVGLVLDASLDLGDPLGFLSLRMIFPLIVMGCFILSAVEKKGK